MMNLKSFTLLALSACCWLASQAQPHAARNEFLLDKGWKFTKGDLPGAQAQSYDDASWQ